MKNYNKIKSEFRRYILKSPEFKDLNLFLDVRTNNGETFEVDQEEQYTILLYDVDSYIIKDDIRDRLPSDTKFIILFINSNFMGFDIDIKCYINGTFEDIDKDNWTELMDSLYKNSDDLLSGYLNAIVDITYTNWLEMRKKTAKFILDVNENNSNSNNDINIKDVKKSFYYFIQSPDFKSFNEHIDKSIENGEYIDSDTYNNECWLLVINDFSDLLDSGNIYNKYIIKHKFRDYYETVINFYHYDGNMFKEISNELDDEDLKSSEIFGSDLEDVYEHILYYSYHNYKKLNNKIDKLFNDINEKVITNFIKFKKFRK